MIGSACNWHCSYCLQGKEVGFDRKEDLDAFCEKFRKYLDDNGIDHFERVQYWGGETLLYLDRIKKLKEAFKDIPRVTQDRIVTNGSLVNDDFVEFVRDNDIYVNVSYHDGQLPEEQWEKVMHIEDLTLTGLFHHHRLTLEDFHKKWEDLWDRYGRCTNWCISTLYATEGGPTDFYFTRADVDQLFDYHKNVVTPLAAEDVFYRRYLDVFSMLFTEHDDIAPEDNFCYNKKVISVDLRGNAYFCHHDCSKRNISGNIFNPLSIHKALPTPPAKCSTCKFQPLCHGGCIRDLTHDVSCYMFQKQYEFLMWLQDTHPEYVSEVYWEKINGKIQDHEPTTE